MNQQDAQLGVYPGREGKRADWVGSLGSSQTLKRHISALNLISDRTGLEAIWSSRWSTPFTGFGSIDLIDGVAWIEAGGAPGAPQLIPLREED